jgi:hypothetical protein
MDDIHRSKLLKTVEKLIHIGYVVVRIYLDYLFVVVS